MTARFPSLLLFLALATATACGGSDAAGGSDASQARDTAVRPVERQPLTDADLMGLDRANIAMELPWTSNRVARDPGAAPRATVASIFATGHDGFDRLVVAFDAGSVMPGYDVALMESGQEVACGGGPQAVSLGSERMLVVRTMPSRATAEDGTRNVRVGTSGMEHTRFREGGMACDDAGTTVWVAGLAEGSEVRVLELRAPARLVVDVR